MSLQRRLTLFFILIVMLPLVAAGLVVRFVVVQEVQERNNAALRPALEVTRRLFESSSSNIDEVVLGSTSSSARLATSLRKEDTQSLNELLRSQVRSAQGVDFIIALSRAGEAVGGFLGPAIFAPGFSTPSIEEIVARPQVAPGGPGFEAQRIPVNEKGGRSLGTLIGGFWIDRSFLSGSALENTNVVVLTGSQPVASTAPVPGPVRIESTSGMFEAEGLGFAEAAELGDSMTVVAWNPPATTIADTVLFYMVGLLLLALIVTGILAYWLARLITQPLDELNQGAVAISQGRFDHQIPVRTKDELGRLANAFNEMSMKLGDSVSQLHSSRDQLQKAIHRVGETLRSTHDRRSILESILNTAADAVAADAAILWSFTPARDELYPSIGRGISVEQAPQIRVGQGLVGHVAERGTTVLKSSRSKGLPASKAEPSYSEIIVVPLFSQDRVVGALSLYRSDSDQPFTTEDLETVVFLSEQGGTAIENVALHEEAQRHSITDGLTGVWNRRYFQMQFRQVIATSLRFGRTFSVLMLDLDNFKKVNDNYGHPRGDAVLIEFAQRVSRTLREVDTFARFGGEEFICILSETDVNGARITSEKIKETIKATVFGGMSDDPLRITVSIGIASYPQHGDSYQSLVGAADQALYRAKQEGRDRYRVAESSASGVEAHS